MTGHFSIHQYHCRIAHAIAWKSTCIDKQVGCLIVDKNNNILATGYNGAPKGHPHCTDLGVCAKEKNGLCLAVHAEINAIIKCPDIQKIDRIYLTLSPCMECMKVILNTSCKQVIFTNYSSKSDVWVSLNLISWSHIKGL